MAEEQKEQEKEPVVYTPEELATINDLTSFFQKAPGQVDLDAEEGEPVEPAGDDEISATDADGAPLTDAAAPKRPIADLSKFDDVLDMDRENFDAPKAGEDLQDIPLTDTPLAEDKSAAPDTALDFDLPPSDGLIDAADTGCQVFT